MKPRYYHSGMAGAPAYVAGTAGMPNVLKACLVNGFNVKAPSSAVAADGVLTLNYSAAPGYELLCWIRIEGASVPAANGDHQVAVVSGNQVAVEIEGLPDGPVGGSISTKVAPAGWSEGTYLTHEYGNGLLQGPSPDLPQRGFRFWQATVSPRLTGYGTVSGSSASAQFPTNAQENNGDVRFLSFNAAGTGNYGSQAWFVVATDRWVYPGGVNGDILSFAGDLAHRVDPGDIYAVAVIGCKSNSSADAAYLAGPASAAGSLFVTAAVPTLGTSRPAWPDTHNALLPYVPVYETGRTPNRLRGVLPNAYFPTAVIGYGAAGKAGEVVSDVNGVNGRVVLFGGGIGVSIDEEAWPL